MRPGRATETSTPALLRNIRHAILRQQSCDIMTAQDCTRGMCDCCNVTLCSHRSTNSTSKASLACIYMLMVASLLQAHVVHMGVGLIHNLLLQQLLNDILNGDHPNRLGRVVLAKPCQPRLAALRCLHTHSTIMDRAGCSAATQN